MRTLLALLLTLAALPAPASGLSLGVDLAYTQTDDVRPIAERIDDLYRPAVDADTYATDLGFVAAWTFNRHFALDLGYSSLGSYAMAIPFQETFLDTTAAYAAGRVSWPLAKGTALYARAGVTHWTTQIDPRVNPEHWNESGTGSLAGVGIEHRRERLGVRVGYDRFGGLSTPFGDLTIDRISVAIIGHFD